MLNDLLHIGRAAGCIHSHAVRLAIEGNDSAGAGSATTVDDEEKTDEQLEQERQEAIERGELDETDDDQPRSARAAKQRRAYDDLKGDRERLKNELDAQKLESQQLKDRLSALETTQTSRQEVNTRTNANLEKSKQRAREVVSEIRKLDKTDPDYSEKVYETMFSRLYTDLPEVSEVISRRTSSETFREERSQEARIQKAEEETIKVLEAAGLGEDDLELVRALAIAKQVTDPGWFKTTKEADQITELVQVVKDRVMKNKRGSQEFKDDRKRHRESMDGVIGEGSRGRRSAGTDDEGSKEELGSILDDLTRLRKSQRRNTSLMLQQDAR